MRRWKAVTFYHAVKENGQHDMTTIPKRHLQATIPSDNPSDNPKRHANAIVQATYPCSKLRQKFDATYQSDTGCLLSTGELQQ